MDKSGLGIFVILLILAAGLISAFIWLVLDIINDLLR